MFHRSVCFGNHCCRYLQVRGGHIRRGLASAATAESGEREADAVKIKPVTTKNNNNNNKTNNCERGDNRRNNYEKRSEHRQNNCATGCYASGAPKYTY